jgi:hypothetical protein
MIEFLVVEGGILIEMTFFETSSSFAITFATTIGNHLSKEANSSMDFG